MCRFAITRARTFTPNFWLLLVEGVPGSVLLSIDSRPKQLNPKLLSATPIASSPKASWTFLIVSDYVSATLKKSLHHLC